MEIPVGTSTEAVSSRNNLLAEVKVGLSNTGTEVRNRIIVQMVEEEVQKRTKATVVIMDKIEALQTEMRKVKPSFSGYTATGQVVGEPVYTKDQVETLKKGKEQLEKLESALEKALSHSDFSKVFELSQK